MFTKKTMLGIGLAGVLGFGASAAVNAATLFVDDFTTGMFDIEISTGAQSSNQAGSMLGGYRNEVLLIYDNPSPSSASAKATNTYSYVIQVPVPGGGFVSQPVFYAGPLQVNVGSGIDYYLRLTYGDDSYNYLPADPLNLDLSGYDRMRIEFSSGVTPASVAAQLFTGSGSVTNADRWEPLGIAAPYVYEFRLADFYPTGGSLSDVDMIYLFFKSNRENLTGADFTVKSISFVSAIPLPAAVWLFGSGLLGLIGVARRKVARSK